MKLRACCLLPALTALLLLPLGGCAGGDARDDRTDREPASGNSLNDMLDRGLTDRRNAGPRTALDAGADDLPPGWRQRIDAWWPLWVQNDPAWPAARQQWVAMGSRATNILVENLIRWHVRAYDLVSRGEVNRSGVELELFRAEAVPYIVTGLSRGMGDSVVRSRLEDLLGRFGEPVVPAIAEALEDADDVGRFSLVRALRKTGSERAVPVLMDQAGRRGDFKVRIEAIKALGELPAPRAAGLLVDCLDDDDSSVRKYAAYYLPELVSGRPRAPLLALIDCMEEATRAGEADVARTCRRSLGKMIGRDLGARPEAWRDVVRGR